jgi:hypothetical protein
MANAFSTAKTKPGNWFNQVWVETVFRAIKTELIWRTIYKTRNHANQEIGA